MTLKDLFLQEKLHFILFGGKGGVGKTTCAATAAIWAAENLNKKILIISTDPAHSLGDSLGQTLKSGEVTKILGFSNLYGLEINPSHEQSQISSSLSMLPQEEFPFGEEFKELLGINLPGIDEAMAFGKVLEYLDNSNYDLIIFDTAPTGHTLRLLSIPEMLSGWMGKIIMLRLRFGKIFGAFRNMFKKGKDEENGEDTIEMIKKLKNSVEKANVILTDPSRTSFVICTISEVMSIYETERLLSTLIQYRIPVNNIVINQLSPENLDCNFCSMRRNMQQKHLEEIRDLYADEFNLTEMPLFDEEIRKPEGLKKFSQYLFK